MAMADRRNVFAANQRTSHWPQFRSNVHTNSSVYNNDDTPPHMLPATCFVFYPPNFLPSRCPLVPVCLCECVSVHAIYRPIINMHSLAHFIATAQHNTAQIKLNCSLSSFSTSFSISCSCSSSISSSTSSSSRALTSEQNCAEKNCYSELCFRVRVHGTELQVYRLVVCVCLHMRTYMCKEICTDIFKSYICVLCPCCELCGQQRWRETTPKNHSRTLYAGCAIVSVSIFGNDVRQ